MKQNSNFEKKPAGHVSPEPAIMIEAIFFEDPAEPEASAENSTGKEIHNPLPVAEPVNLPELLSPVPTAIASAKDDIVYSDIAGDLTDSSTLSAESKSGPDELPGDSLAEPCPYVPVPIDKTQFVKASCKSEKSSKSINGVLIYRYLRKAFKLRIYADEVYVFCKEKGVYERYSVNDLYRLINRCFGEQIADTDNLSAYYDAKDYIFKDHNLAVKETAFLPLRYWIFQNGLLDIHTGKIIENTGNYFVRHALQSPYNANAQCPAFDQYIQSVAAGDSALIFRLWECIGYLLSRDTNGKVFFSFVGKKDTGKSLLARIITNIVGDDAVSHLNANEFSGRFDVAELNGRHLNICMDLPNRILSADAVGKIKALTGNDIIRSDVKYRDSVNFKATARLLFGSNSQIRTDLFDPAFNDRMILVPFNYPVPQNRQDFFLEQKLMMEKEGICLKALSYYLALVKKNYRFTPVDLADDIDASIDYNLVIHSFAEENCIFTSLEKDKIATSDLYSAFQDYCCAKTLEPLGVNEFSKKFRDLFSDKIQKKKIKMRGLSINGFVGIMLKQNGFAS